MRSSVKPTWALTNSSCVHAPKTWTRWSCSRKSLRAYAKQKHQPNPFTGPDLLTPVRPDKHQVIVTFARCSCVCPDFTEIYLNLRDAFGHHDQCAKNLRSKTLT
jgi:hypothetical protein